MKFKQSFFRRISPIFLAAVVLVSSLPVSAASTASNASSTLVSGSFSEASDGYYQISGTWVFNEVVSFPEFSVDLWKTLPYSSPLDRAFVRNLSTDILLTGFYVLRSNMMGSLFYCQSVVGFLENDLVYGERFGLTPFYDDSSVSSGRFLSSVSRYFIFDDETYISSHGFEWLSRNATPYVDLEAAAHEKTNSFLSVISSIGDWIVSSFLSLVALFWVPDSGMTFFGVLAVSGLAFALIFLLIRWILSLFHR